MRGYILDMYSHLSHILCEQVKYSFFWRSFLLVHFQAIWERRWQTKKVWELGCMLGVSLLVGAYNT